MGFGGVRRAVSDGINDFLGVRFKTKIYLGYDMQPKNRFGGGSRELNVFLYC